MISRINTSKGSALIIVLVILGIGTLAVVTMFRTTESFMNFGRVSRKGVDLKLKAESGLELAKVDLEDRRVNADYDTIVANPVDVGLVYDDNAGRNCKEPTDNCVPRFLKTDGKIQISVYYIPDKRNAQDGVSYALVFPKFFTVVSEATNTTTGEIHTVEAFFQIKRESYAEITFGMLDPQPVLGVDTYEFTPSIYGGHVHFGKFPNGKLPYFRRESNTVAEKNYHTFKGPVTFEGTPPPGEDHPFDKHDYSTMNFEKGYISGFELAEDTVDRIDNIYNQTAQKATLNLSGYHVCLKFVASASGGEMHQYNCNDNTLNPRRRYKGETSDTGATGPIAVYPINKSVVVCGDENNSCNLHVKGIVKGEVTVAANNIVIEGDIQYWDQDKKTSPDRFGAVAKKNIKIPNSVPNGYQYTNEWYAHKQNEKNPVNTQWHDVTNFVPPTEDRDAGTEGYFYCESCPPKWFYVPEGKEEGWINTISTLDLDGQFMAIGGILDVEGFSDSKKTGNQYTALSIVDKNNKVWAATDKGNKAYYYKSGGVWYRQAEPKACERWDNSINKCKMFREAHRSMSWNIWIFGGLVVGGYSFTNNSSDSGFQKRVINADERLFNKAPPGFPESDVTELQLLWVKNYGGKSSQLTPEQTAQL